MTAALASGRKRVRDHLPHRPVLDDGGAPPAPWTGRSGTRQVSKGSGSRGQQTQAGGVPRTLACGRRDHTAHEHAASRFTKAEPPFLPAVPRHRASRPRWERHSDCEGPLFGRSENANLCAQVNQPGHCPVPSRGLGPWASPPFLLKVSCDLCTRILRWRGLPSRRGPLPPA